MNLPRFLKETDAIIAALSKEALGAFIHETARTLPESQRAHFLQKLQEAGQTADKKASAWQEAPASTSLQASLPAAQDTTASQAVPAPQAAAPVPDDTAILRQQALAIQDKLMTIDAGDVYLIGSWEEEYQDWYGDDNGDYSFQDPDHLLDTIDEACRLAHQCVDAELYKESYDLTQTLLALEVKADGDYAGYTGGLMDWGELLSYDLISVNQKQFTLDALYAAYQALPMEARPQELFQIFHNTSERELTLEHLLQNGEEELPEWNKFLPLWIEYLGGQSGNLAAKLLQEALSMQEDTDQTIKIAQKFAKRHPEIYKELLQNGLQREEDDKWLAVGKEALADIPVSYQIRSQVALLTAVYALRQGKQEEAEQCWLEAFRSDTCIIHYLRLQNESQSFARYQADIRAIYEELYGQKNDSPHIATTLPKNELHATTYYALCFFNGEIPKVLSGAMDVKQSLGWSGTFMKTGLALLLLYLYEGKTLQPGVRQMCAQAAQDLHFQSAEYAQGLLHPVEENDALCFWQNFCRWKQQAAMPIAEEELLTWLEKRIAKRTKAIMENNRRNCYEECAAFLAALGEAMESRKVLGAKQKLLLAYQEQYPRRRTFHEALRSFGMPDTRYRR